MRNSEHLALFVMGVATLGVTFLLLFALDSKNPVRTPKVVEQVQIPVVQQAAAVPQPQPQVQAPEPPSIDVLDREVAETYAKAAAYLARSTFEEKEHIALLERLEFYRGLRSITLERKKTAHDLIKDMNLLLTLKESVARRVKLSGQINAAVTDAYLHLTEGERNEAVARKIMDRINRLYAIHGLSEDQNKKLITSLTGLKNAYKATGTSTASAPAPSRQAKVPKVLKSKAPAPSRQAKVSKVQKPKAPAPTRQSKVSKVQKPRTPAPTKQAKVPEARKPKAPASNRQADIPDVLKSYLNRAMKDAETKPSATNKTKPQVAAPKVKPKTVPETAPSVRVAASAPVKTKPSKQPAPRINKKYYKIMTEVSQYLILKKYDKPQHAKLTDKLYELSGSAGSLSAPDQERLSQAIENMELFVLSSKGFVGAWGSKK
ncbi:hypothetical protein LCGC14_1960810 [marine sediment metagenome]|uniref:Uncharacterized protein n=1 Tax=marine sediment metagenome TaxID=412755 RepID=A0A0F9FEN5_9ZZZZ